MKKIQQHFYTGNDVLQIARKLLGKILVTTFNGIITAGHIVEVEAYNGIIDRASHSYGGRRTDRNEVMYADGGVCYIYLCYGIHHLFNVVTNKKEIPEAILIRALEPVKGIAEMQKRSGKKSLDNTLTKGPGNLSKAMGLNISYNNFSLKSEEIFIAEDGFVYSENEIATSPRIGVEYAGADALLPYRFYVKGNPYVSGKPK